MTGIFRKIQSLFTGITEQKQSFKYIEKQRELQNSPKQQIKILKIEKKYKKTISDNTPQGDAFINRLLKRRAKRDFAFLHNRKIRKMYA